MSMDPESTHQPAHPVTVELCRILSERHPEMRWMPLELDEYGRPKAAGGIVRFERPPNLPRVLLVTVLALVMLALPATAQAKFLTMGKARATAKTAGRFYVRELRPQGARSYKVQECVRQRDRYVVCSIDVLVHMNADTVGGGSWGACPQIVGVFYRNATTTRAEWEAVRSGRCRPL
jgi:hypothetical protein